MPTYDHAATDCLLFVVLGICSRVAIAVDATTYLHTEYLAAIAYQPLYISLCVNMALNRALHIVLGFGACGAAFPVAVLNAVVLNALHPIPRRAQDIVVVFNPFARH